jgi:hypothetical protein
MLKLTIPIDRKLTLNQLIRTLLNSVGVVLKSRGTIQQKIAQASAIYYAQKKGTESAIVRAIENTFLPDFKEGQPFLIYCVWRPKDRKLDQDNLTTCLKAILDALVNQGVIPDDSPKYTEPVLLHIFDYNYVGKTNNGSPLQETVDVHITQSRQAIDYLNNSLTEFMTMDGLDVGY